MAIYINFETRDIMLIIEKVCVLIHELGLIFST